MWGHAVFFFSFIMCVCLCMCARVHAIACIWRSEDKWQLLIPSVYCIDWVTRLGNWAIILQSHLADPVLAFFFWYLCSWGLVKSHRILHFFLIYQDKKAMGSCRGWVTANRYISMISLCSFKTVKEMEVCHCPIVYLMRGTRLILGMTSLTEKHVKKTHKAITSEIPQKLGLARTGSNIRRLFWGTRKDPVCPSTVSESQCHGASRAKDELLVGTII